MVYCVEEDRLGFQEGDAVTFSELHGMPELQARGPFRVRSVKPYMLELDVDSSGFAPHESGARACACLRACAWGAAARRGVVWRARLCGGRM